MKKIGFIGAYDKIDMIIHVAKILTLCEKKVLVVDTTFNQKTRYIVPAVNPTAAYITEFENIDFAVGFQNLEQLEQYINTNVKQSYDIMLIDVDTPYNVEKYGLEQAEKNYFVAGYDIFTIKRGIQLVSLVQNPIKLTKIIFSLYMTKEESDYLEYLSLGHKIVWDKKNLYFPLGNEDWIVIAENQRNARINLKKISNEYKEALASLVDDMMEELNENQIKRAIKRI